jgi:hypothetical protein
MGREISPKGLGHRQWWLLAVWHKSGRQMSESPTRQQAPTAISAFSLMNSQPSQASNLGKQIDEASIADISNVSTVQQLPKITFKDRISTRTFVLEIHLDKKRSKRRTSWIRHYGDWIVEVDGEDAAKLTYWSCRICAKRSRPKLYSAGRHRPLSSI